jgi:leader peptidase (prepilin peptidase) / N-methyltransferase
MEIVYSIFIGLFGLVLGSFYNVIGLRMPKGESIVNPPSHCTACDRRLTAFELIPVVSYVVQGGKCKGCGTQVSPIYCVTEIATAVLFTASYLKFGFTAELAVALLFVSLLVIINVSDLAYMLIPNKILLFFLPLLIIARIISPLDPWWDSLLGAAVGFGILLLITVISKGGMGGGDIKLFFVIGLVLGTVNTLLTLFLASLIGMITGIVILKVRGQGRKTPIPFGPSIALGAVIAYFYGADFIEWYWQLF